MGYICLVHVNSEKWYLSVQIYAKQINLRCFPHEKDLLPIPSNIDTTCEDLLLTRWAHLWPYFLFLPSNKQQHLVRYCPVPPLQGFLSQEHRVFCYLLVDKIALLSTWITAIFSRTGLWQTEVYTAADPTPLEKPSALKAKYCDWAPYPRVDTAVVIIQSRINLEASLDYKWPLDFDQATASNRESVTQIQRKIMCCSPNRE